jgi:hypothetical protein
VGREAPGTSGPAVSVTPLTQPITRRQVLGGSFASTAGAVMLRDEHIRRSADAAREVSEDPREVHTITAAQPIINYSVVRPEDMVVLDFTFCGFTLEKGPKHPKLVANAKQVAYTWIGVIVNFPPQAVGEANYDYIVNATIPFDPTPVLSQVSGPSRLCFTFAPGSVIQLPTGNVQDLLLWDIWNMSVAPAALSGSGSSGGVAPAFYQTAIECPLALILSPVTYPTASLVKGETITWFANRLEPPAPSPIGVTDLWITQLQTTYVVESGETVLTQLETPEVCPVWATDFTNPSGNDESFINYGPYVVIT